MRSSDASSARPASLRFLRSAVSPVGAWFARCVARPTQRLDLISGVSIPRVSVKTTRPPRFPGAPMHVRHVLGPRLDLRLLHGETSTSSSPVLTVDNSNDRPTEAGPEFLSRLDRMASRSLCTLRSQRHRWATQHSVPAGLLGLAGQVHLLLGHFTRFQLFFMRPPRPSSSGATERENSRPGASVRGTGL